MPESPPPPVEVTSTGTKIDYGDVVLRSAKTAAAPDTPRVTDESQDKPRDRS